MIRRLLDIEGRTHERATLTITYDLNLIGFNQLTTLLRMIPGIGLPSWGLLDVGRIAILDIDGVLFSIVVERDGMAVEATDVVVDHDKGIIFVTVPDEATVYPKG